MSSLVSACAAMCVATNLWQLQCTFMTDQQLISVCPCAQTASWPGVWGPNSFLQQPQNDRSQTPESAREALKFVFSAEGAFFRDFIMDELVRSIDAMSRSVGVHTACVLCVAALASAAPFPPPRPYSRPLPPFPRPLTQLAVLNKQKGGGGGGGQAGSNIWWA